MNDSLRRYLAVSADDQSLSVAEDRIPTPGADEILIEVAAAGVNRADLLQRRGLYPPPADASPILGLEVAGTVIARGEAAQRYQLGDRVCALTHGGGYASHAVAPEGQSMPIPDGFSATEAAALPEALLTVWHNVYQRAGLKAGETILIHGGASGIGTIAVALCSARGSTVCTTAGTAEKCRRLKELGASHAINYREQDFTQVLDELGLGESMDVILDMVGGDYIQKNLTVAAVDGRIVNIAYMGGFSAEVNFLPVLMKRLTLTASTLRRLSAAQKAAAMNEICREVMPLLERGELRPIVDSEYALSDAEAAHARMESGEHMGKIVLIP